MLTHPFLQLCLDHRAATLQNTEALLDQRAEALKTAEAFFEQQRCEADNYSFLDTPSGSEVGEDES